MADIDLFADSTIPPTSLRRFLVANRWSVVEDRPSEWDIFRSPSDLPPLTLTLVYDEEYDDYHRRLKEAIQAVTHAYSLSLAELSERITALSADLFFFRIQQESKDGTIPFKQAQRALENIATMVRAAATTAANPHHSHKGRRPAEVDEFIAEDFRLGHTKRGSFVVTAAARFDRDASGDASDDLPQSVPNSDSGENGTPDANATETIAEPADGGGDAGNGDSTPSNDVGVVPFGRKVMTTFSRGLSAAYSVATDSSPVTTAIEQGLSLELAEALERVSNEEGLQTIEISFDWSESLPAPAEGTAASVVFERQVLDSLPTVTQKLQTKLPPAQTTIIGPVKALSRDLMDEETSASGEVTIVAEIDNRMRNVVVSLEGQAHQYAIRAYRDRFPVVVSGELVKRRRWQLEGRVEMDLEAAELMATRSRVLPAPSPPPEAIEAPASSEADDSDAGESQENH